MKKILLSIMMMLVVALSASAEGMNGIIAYVDGGTEAYLLSEQPRVTYSDNSAILSVGGVEVATVDLSGDKALSIVYGEYQPTAINGINADAVTATTQNGKKYIKGGRLIIIKDGKQYDAAGKEVLIK